MRAGNGNVKPKRRLMPELAVQRRGLLAKVHIAKDELGLKQVEYEAVLERFGAESAADLRIYQLEEMIHYFKRLGWQPSAKRKVALLRERVAQVAAEMRDGDKRLPGLLQKFCGVERLEWAQDPARLIRMLAALGKIKEMETNGLIAG